MKMLNADLESRTMGRFGAPSRKLATWTLGLMALFLL